ncbi:hypothetical protein CcCBS67573_g07427 [Chytriomyces confervae]|uniref:4-hydroxyphenylpyruvate dioxygenase n=1 Tax=Chytriomyces confervae TaxID=246404 RepID=A0A507EWP5_9FUNG|nr:hypothetical protein CcCBS67573_g07427 [Chytriomyces confervae]
MLLTSKLYETAFDFRRFWFLDDKPLYPEKSIRQCIIMADYDEVIKMHIYEPSIGRVYGSELNKAKNLETQEFVKYNTGAGVQNIALETNDIIKSVSNLRARGVEFMPIPAAYYSHLAECLETAKCTIAEPLAVLEQLGILVDFEDEGYLLQIFTKPLVDRPTLSIEIIQHVKCEGIAGDKCKFLMSNSKPFKSAYAIMSPLFFKQPVEAWNGSNDLQLDYTNLLSEEKTMVIRYSSENYMFHLFRNEAVERYVLGIWQSAEEWNKASIDNKRRCLKEYRALSLSPGFLCNREQFLDRVVRNGLVKAVVIEDAKLSQTIEKQAILLGKVHKLVRSDVFDSQSIQAAIAAAVTLDTDVMSRLMRGDFKYVLPYPPDRKKLAVIESTKTDEGDLDGEMNMMYVQKNVARYAFNYGNESSARHRARPVLALVGSKNANSPVKPLLLYTAASISSQAVGKYAPIDKEKGNWSVIAGLLSASPVQNQTIRSFELR